jgi:hypothetical protein
MAIIFLSPECVQAHQVVEQLLYLLAGRLALHAALLQAEFALACGAHVFSFAKQNNR